MGWPRGVCVESTPRTFTQIPGIPVPQVLLKLISSMATAELLAELVTTYQRSTGISVMAEAAGGVAVLQRIQAGEAADVVVLAGNVIDKLIVEGRLLVGTRLDLVRSGIAVAVRAGAPKPSIADEAAVRQAVLNAKTLSFSTGPSGVYLEKLFERWGILETIRSRIVVPPPGIPVGTLVADGPAREADLVAWCRSRMAGYKAPRSVTFVAELPLNAAGKVDKPRLEARLASRRDRSAARGEQ